MNLPEPRRSEIWWVQFDPSVGGEIKKTRPAVIVSNNKANQYFNRVQVVPLTSNTQKLYNYECLITLNGKTSKALGDQITTISKLRLKKKMAVARASEMELLEKAILIQLGINF